MARDLNSGEPVCARREVSVLKEQTNIVVQQPAPKISDHARDLSFDHVISDAVARSSRFAGRAQRLLQWLVLLCETLCLIVRS